MQAAGISKKLAPTVGIAVDHRRKNRSLESLQENVARLNTYKAKLIVFPRRSRKVKVCVLKLGRDTLSNWMRIAQADSIFVETWSGTWFLIVLFELEVKLPAYFRLGVLGSSFFGLNRFKTANAHFNFCFCFCPQSGDATSEELASAMQVQGPVLPIVHVKPAVDLVSITDELKSNKAYYKLRMERVNAKLVGIRKKRAAEAEKDEKK